MVIYEPNKCDLQALAVAWATMRGMVPDGSPVETLALEVGRGYRARFVLGLASGERVELEWMGDVNEAIETVRRYLAERERA